MTGTMIRVSKRTRDSLMTIAANDYDGVTLDEAVQRLAREHWERQAIAAMDRYREDNPGAWQDYLDEMEDLDKLADPIIDE